MYAIFGLGNPGRKYQLTRHNIGFLLLDLIQNKFKVPLKPGRGDYYYYKVCFRNKDILFVKPTTFMNRSGRAIKQVIDHFEILPENFLVAYDDFHLDIGMLRFRAKGSAGGHNGIESIIEQIESESFPRLKIGIGSDFDDSVEYVLTPFKKEEIEKLERILKVASEGIFYWLDNGIEPTMSRFNGNVLEVE